MPLIRRSARRRKRAVAPHGPGIVLALGGGGAPGIAHIGVLQALTENGIRVRAIAGTSIGAEIGAFVAAGVPLQELAGLATRFDWKQTVSLFLPDLPTGGLISGERIVEFLQAGIGPHTIEQSPIGYVAVASDLESGEQVVIDRGDLVAAVRASISLPGIMAPHPLNGRFLVDGGVVNPLPFDVAREHFGGPVVAVAVHAGALGFRRASAGLTPQWVAQVHRLLEQPWMAQAGELRAWLEAQIDNEKKRKAEEPYWIARRVLGRVYEIGQTQLVRLRGNLAPPDLVIAPEVGDIGLLEFYRAQEAIDAGRHAAQKHLRQLRQLAEVETRGRVR